jgi:hypothetical protein
MAKRKRSHRRKTHSRRRTSLSAPRSRRRRSRRHLGAGGKMFKFLSDPVVGGAVGGLAGMILSKVVQRVAKGNPIVGAVVPFGIAFVVKKKVPFVAAGLASGSTVVLVKDSVGKLAPTNPIYKLLAEEAHFINDHNLLNDSPVILAADGTPIPYSLEEVNAVLSEEMGEPYYSMSEED